MKKKAEEAIRLAVPELQNVESEGCLLIHKKSGCECQVMMYNDEADSCSLYCYEDEYAETVPKDEVLEEYKVIGSDIYLEHIILANRINESNMSVMVYNEHNIVCKYNMCKSFTEQSEEFYKFILEILS